MNTHQVNVLVDEGAQGLTKLRLLKLAVTLCAYRVARKHIAVGKSNNIQPTLIDHSVAQQRKGTAEWSPSRRSLNTGSL